MSRINTNGYVILAVFTCSWMATDSSFGLQAQQSASNPNTNNEQPLEYIRSSSPLPGGGVVSSIYAPGQAGVTYNAVRNEHASIVPTSGRVANNPGINSNVANVANRNQVGQSILDPRLSAGQANINQAQQPLVYGQPPQLARAPRPVYQVPTRVMQTPQQALPGRAYVQPVNTVQPNIMTSSSLGVPTTLNRSMRPNCAGCSTGGVGGYGQPLASPPAYLPSPASLPPTLGTTPGYSGTTMLSPQRSTYTPLVRLQNNVGPNVYAGQGIVGSPKLYVDGQPVRNFLRYVIIP